MKKTVLFLVSLCLAASCTFNTFDGKAIDPDKDPVFINRQYVSDVNLTEFNDVGKQYYFIKVWGFLKYYADFNDVPVKWDDYFMDNIERIKGMDQKQYREFINTTIALFPKPELKKNKNKGKDFCLLDNSWFNNRIYTDATAASALNILFENYDGASAEFIGQSSSGALKFLNESPYNESDFPAATFRLLGLARYWTIINYFYVYKNDSSENWDTVLTESIPEFNTAENDKQYHLALQKLISKLYDCHSLIQSDVLDVKVYGRYAANVRAVMLDSTVMIKRIRTALYDDGSLKPGDIVIKIDGEDAIVRYRKLNEFLRGANGATDQRIICPYLFSSVKDHMLLIIARDGKELTIHLKLRDYSKYVAEEARIRKQQHESVVIEIYPNSTAYIDLNKIASENIEKNFNAARPYQNIILDTRQGLHGTTVKVADFVLKQPTTFFKYTYADITHPGMLRILDGFRLGKKDSTPYKGKVYVLVDEHTQSESEFLTMALQTGSNVTVVGSRTAGSDGNVKQVNFPGNIETLFSGLGIYYPDLKPTQRVGIKIDCNVRQTLDGIVKGKDEILNKALELSAR
jgi:carboxyl-terminal processing protease